MVLLELAGSEKAVYLDSLLAAMKLAQECKFDDDGLRQEVLNLLQLLRGEEHFYLYPSIKIESSRSGFPHLSTIHQPLLDRKYAPTILGQLPTQQQCVEKTISQLHTANTDFSPLQQELRKIKAYTELQTIALPPLHEASVRQCERSEEFHSYSVAYKGFDVAKMRFLRYGLLIYQKDDTEFLHQSKLAPALEALIQKNAGLSAAEMFYSINQQREFAVISVERLVLGPFSSKHMENEVGTEEALLQSTLEYPFVLEVEQQASEDDQTYLTADLRGALKAGYKTQFHPRITFKRHFFCSDQTVFEVMGKRYLSPEYRSYFYVADKKDIETTATRQGKQAVETSHHGQ